MHLVPALHFGLSRRLPAAFFLFVLAQSPIAADDTASATNPPPATTGYAIIPNPVKLQPGTGRFNLDSGTVIITNANSASEGSQLAEILHSATGANIPVSRAADGKHAIHILKNASHHSLGKEGYELEITPGLVRIEAGSSAGLFYAFQTIKQLLPLKAENADLSKASASLPCLNITDYPRFKHRGLLVDSARHFIKPDNIKKIIDLMAAYKLNALHWHLTDDQGWRLEIKHYPKLTEIGSVRASSSIPGNSKKQDGKPYGGFYTQDEVKDILAFARERHVMVIPEIDMPGHSSAAVTAYPEFGNSDVPGFHPHISVKAGRCKYNLSLSDKTFSFVDGVLDEVCSLFPDSPYIHMGGDECDPEQWLQSPSSREIMKAQGLTTGADMERYFMNHVEKSISIHGKRMIGWDELMENNASPTTIIQVWRNGKWAVQAAQKDHDVILSPKLYFYFDKPQGSEPVPPGYENFGSIVNLETVYKLEPMPKELHGDEQKHILGIEAALWGEFTYNEAKLEYMLFPRLFATSEVAWSPDAGKVFADFKTRVLEQERRLDQLGVNYRKDDGSAALPNLPIVTE